MFYKVFIDLCNSKGVSPSYVGGQIGISKAAVSGWKNGSLPRDTQLQKIAAYFGVSVGYLMGTSDVREIEKDSAPAEADAKSLFLKKYDVLTPDEQKQVENLVDAFVLKHIQG